MTIDELIQKQEIEIDNVKYLISNIPAIQAQEIYGEIIRATTDIGDIGMTFLPVGIAKKLLAFAAFHRNGEKAWSLFETETDIDVGCKDVQTLIKLEAAMIRKNFGFLFDGGLLKVLEELRSGQTVS